MQATGGPDMQVWLLPQLKPPCGADKVLDGPASFLPTAANAGLWQARGIQMMSSSLVRSLSTLFLSRVNRPDAHRAVRPVRRRAPR